MPPSDGRRTASMLKRHEAGATLQEIADTYGISRERVRQILKKAGAEMRGSGRRRGAAEIKAARAGHQAAAMAPCSAASLPIRASSLPAPTRVRVPYPPLPTIRNVTALVMGDPPPGRSALDQRRAAE